MNDTRKIAKWNRVETWAQWVCRCLEQAVRNLAKHCFCGAVAHYARVAALAALAALAVLSARAVASGQEPLATSSAPSAGPISQPGPISQNAPPGRKVWMKSPAVTLMTGFIYEPLKPYTVQHWQQGLGSRFDADRWVRDFKEVGAEYVIFYDKWIDGLVFHDTKTTGYKTKRDFVGELAAACQRHQLRLVFYFNAVSDGNPEYDAWATRDRQGKPIVFAPMWPTRYQTLHSPFREKALAQARELLTRYGPIDGIWHDIFNERLDTSSPWVAAGYEKMYGEKFEKASGARLAEFDARTLADWLDRLEAIRREAKQDRCIYTSNGSGGWFLASGVWTRHVGARLDYLMDEGHSFDRNDALARMAWVLPKPYEVNFLLNSSWFTPLGDAPPSHLTEKQVLAASAVVVCRGASVNFALTPGHDGRFGEDLDRAKAAGRWFQSVRSYLADAQPYADMGVVLGTPAVDSQGFAPVAWTRPLASPQAASQQAFALEDAALRQGLFGRVLYAWDGRGSWPTSLAAYPAVLLPEHSMLDGDHAEQLRRYVRDGGTLVAFAKASLAGSADGVNTANTAKTPSAAGAPRGNFALADLFGLQYRGELPIPVDRTGASVKVDSEYSPEFAGPHLLDGIPTAWASGGTPMPHWAEITLPKPVEVHRVELTSREGPYLVTDADVEWADGAAWRPAASVRNAPGRTITLPLATPATTNRIRVTIRRELYEGKDRQYADVEAIRVLDRRGRNWAAAGNKPLEVRSASADWAGWFPGPLSLAPWAVAVEPTSAEVVARFDLPGDPPAMTRNRFGRGQVIFVAVSDQTLRANDAFWSGLRRWVRGGPTLDVSPVDASRFRFILTRVGENHVLHVVDAAVSAAGYRPKSVSISLDANRLGQPRRAFLAGSNQPVPIDRVGSGDERIRFVVTPDPVASVVLK
jgi:hypothetical protein